MKLSGTFASLAVGASLASVIASLMAQTPAGRKPAAGSEQVISLIPVAAPAVSPDKVVMTIGDQKITAGQLDQILDAFPANYQVYARGPGRQQFAEVMVQTFVLAQEAKRRKMDETATYAARIMWSQADTLARLMNDDIKNNAKLEEADVRNYYAAHKSDSDRVRARHILVRTSGSPLPVKPGQKDLTEAEALARAQELRQRIQGGADFIALAKTESDDTTSGANGGDLDFIRRGQTMPGFEQAAFDLKVGEVSEPVKTPLGFHLIKVEARDSKSFEEMRLEIEKSLLPGLAKKRVEDLVAKSKVVLDPEYFGAPAIKR
jgi:peptidyl-prolyl cis-trans isomerase C